MAPSWSCRGAPCRSPDRTTVEGVERTFDPIRLNRQVEGMSAAHQRMLAGLEGLGDDDVRRPSRLPAWSVGHVLAHIEFQADSFTRLFEAAEGGTTGEQYPGGMPARVEAIDSASTRTATDHVAGIRRAVYSLEGAIARARDGWYADARLVSGIIVPMTDLPLRRWREVEVHLGDLGWRDFDGHRCWSSDYVREDLIVMSMQWKSRGSMGLTDLPPAVGRRPDPEKLAWLLGRLDVEEVEPARLIG